MVVACRPVYHLLCGISLEVLMKGILAERGMTPPATHNLVSLACDVGLSLDDDDQRLFRYYQSTFIWGGRYPLPRDPTPDKLRDYWDNAIEVLTTSEPIATGSFIHRIGASGRTGLPFKRCISGSRSCAHLNATSERVKTAKRANPVHTKSIPQHLTGFAVASYVLFVSGKEMARA